jgi:WD40 repeat protein/DNA-binding SARP family transcriptional activator
MSETVENPDNIPSLEIYTFGGLRIVRGGEAVTGLASRKVEALMVYLAATGRPQPREHLADFLWDDFSQSKAMNNLRVVLSNLRKHLGDYLTIARDAVSVNAESHAWLDVAALESLLQAAQEQEGRTGALSAESASRVQEAVALYDGEFLQGFSVRGSRGFDDWSSLERERLNRLVLEGLNKLVGWQLERGEYAAGIESANRWLQLDPLRERAHQQMMLLLAYNGYMAAALEQYDACQRILDEELGVSPSDKTVALYERIKASKLPPLAQERIPPAEKERKPPFKGMQYFDVADADLFFGREQLTARLAGKLRDQRFLAVVGASGSGKSSLVRAGLVPALMSAEPLADGSRPPAGSGQWPVHIITPTPHPLEALAASLTRDAESVTATATLMDDLAKEPRSLHLYARKLLAQDGGGRLLLLVDQFEELFTLCRDENERKAFIDNLITAVSSSTAGPTVVAITLRADFYAHCAQYEALWALLERQQAHVGQMAAEELRRAIEGPAHREGYDFEPGLVDLFLRDIGATEEGQPEPGALPLLSHALLETWKRRRDQTLTFAGYSESGGVRGAIAQTAEQVFHQQLTAEQQAIARDIFLRLTELGEGIQDTRRRATIEELVPREEERAAVEAVLQILADARLVTMSEGTAEVAHEALIRQWPQLREWLDEGRERLRLHRQLTEAAQGWQELERDPGALYRGTRLARAGAWIEEQAPQLNPLEREFLDTSQAFERQQEEEREAQRKRELEAARSLAASEQRRADEQARAAEQLRRRRRYLVGALAAASLLTVVAVFFGVQFRQSAAVAERESRIGLARELALRSLDTLQADPELSLLVAVEAIEITQDADGFITSEAAVALYRALIGSSFRILLPGVGAGNDGTFIVFSPDGASLVTSSYAGGVPPKLWDWEGKPINSGEGYPSSTSYAAFIGPQGTRLLTKLRGDTVKLWDVEGGLIATLDGANMWFASSPDGKRIVSGGKDGIARLWDVEGGFIADLRGHGDDVNWVAFSPDGTRIITADFDGTARLWDAHGNPVAILEGHNDAVMRAIFSPDGRRILTMSLDASARLWGADGELIMSLEGVKCLWMSFPCADFSPDGISIVATSLDGPAWLWHTDRNFVSELEGHAGPVESVDFSPDGTRIVTGSADGTARLWDGEGNFITVLRGHSAIVNAAQFSPDGRLIATGSFDGTARLWELEGVPVAELRGHEDWVQSAAYLPDGRQILTTGADGTVRLWSTDGDLLHTLEGHTGVIWSVALSPDGSRIVTAGADGTARLWNSGGKLQATLEGHEQAVRWAAFSPDGQLIVTAGDDGIARLWGSDGTLHIRLEDHMGSTRTATFSPNGTYLVTAGRDSVVRLWDAAGNLLAALTGHSGGVDSALFSPDGKQLVTAGRDGTGRLWDVAAILETGLDERSVTVLEGHGDWVNWVDFSPDGTSIVTAGSEGTARLWDGQGNLVAILEGHTGPVLWAGFSPNGLRIATTSEDGTARLWDGEGNFFAAFEGHSGPVQSAAFGPDGTQLVTVSQDGSARIWNVWPDVEAMLQEVAQRALRPMTNAECRQYLHLEQCPQE